MDTDTDTTPPEITPKKVTPKKKPPRKNTPKKSTLSRETIKVKSPSPKKHPARRFNARKNPAWLKVHDRAAYERIMKAANTPTTRKAKKMTTNGHATPSYTPNPVGRPRGTYREPVRTGLLHSLRTIKEISTNWASAVVFNEQGEARIINKAAAELCGAQIRLLADRLKALTSEVESRISEQ